MPHVEEPADDGVFSPAVENAKGKKRLINTAFGVTIGSVFQPLQVSKVLIQVRSAFFANFEIPILRFL